MAALAASPPGASWAQDEEVDSSELGRPWVGRALRDAAAAPLARRAGWGGQPDPWSVEHPDPRQELPAVQTRPKTWRRGVALGLFASTRDEARQRQIYGDLLDEIEAVGATDLSIVVRWAQADVEAASIEPAEDVTVDDELVTWVIEAAHQRGLRVFLLPIIHVRERARGVWRGTLAPTDPEAWWGAYARFILHYAGLSHDHGVELFSVGSELLSLEREDARWRALIAQVRERFDGELTYSANWDHFEVPTFWDALDVAGVTAYQELTDQPNPTVETIRSGWRLFRVRLTLWSMSHDLRVLFTEIGYPTHRQAAAHPWDYTARGPAAPMLQARCYRAMVETWHDEEVLAGIFIWNWFGFRGPKDRGYTPRGKPAEAILRHWYEGSLPEPP